MFAPISISAASLIQFELLYCTIAHDCRHDIALIAQPKVLILVNYVGVYKTHHTYRNGPTWPSSHVRRQPALPNI